MFILNPGYNQENKIYHKGKNFSSSVFLRKISCNCNDLFVIIVLYKECACFAYLNYTNISFVYKGLFEYLCIHYISIIFLQ